MIRLATAIVIMMLPLPVLSEDAVRVVSIPLSSSIVPDTQILIRNTSGYDLSVWVAGSDGNWNRYEITADNSVLIKLADAAVGIATTESDAEDNVLPTRQPGTISAEGETDGLFFFRKLSGGTRALFCWSPSRDRWMIQIFGERVCI